MAIQGKKGLTRDYPGQGQGSSGKDKTIRFSMKADQETRDYNAKISAEIIKLKQGGFPIKSSYSVPPPMAREYKLKPSENFQVIEFNKLSDEEWEEVQTFVVTRMNVQIFKKLDFTHEDTGMEATLVIVDLTRV